MRGGRRLGALLLGTLLATVIAWSPAAVQPALAAGPLGVRAATTYTVDPRDGVVHVAIAYTVTNNKPNTASIIYFYRTLTLGVQPGARSVRAADGAGGLGVGTTKHRTYTEVQLQLRANLYYHRTTSFTLRYELAGGKPRSDSPIRVGRAFVTFGAWAFGDHGAGTVEVRMPPGFTTTTEGDDMTRSGGSSGVVLQASPANPNGFFAVVTGEDPAEYDQHRLSLPGGADVVVLSWPEDSQWDASVSGTLQTGFPKLEDLVGLPWPVTHDLNVRERYTPALEGYAGLFFSNDERIDVTEDIDPVTILHEASHAWFNEHLFSNRWVYEGLAEEYAWRVQTAVGRENVKLPAKPPAPRIQLNGWAFPKVVRDDTSDIEVYGYGASFWLVHLIVDTAGEDRMRDAFAAADANLTAYPGHGPAETVAAVDDWRRLLDLTQPIDEPDPVPVKDAVGVYAVGEFGELTDRTLAREAYRKLIAAGDGWLPPWYVRRPMGEWDFQHATPRMTEATAVLALRDQAQAAAVAEGLILDTADLRSAYEGAKDGFDAATALGRKDIAAVEAIAGAHDAVDSESDLVTQIGLLGETPRTGYDAARAAFESGDADGAIAGAQATERLLSSAPARGRERLVMGGIVVVALAGFLVLILVLRRRRAAAPFGVQPGSPAFLALDARFSPVPPRGGAGRGSEAGEASGTLGGHPDAPPPPLGEAPSDIEREADAP